MDLNKVLEQVKSLVEGVAKFIYNESQTFDISKIEYKGFNDLVSYVDKEAENRLVEGLSSILPAAGFITEEGTTDKVGEEYQWIIDPLDGTTNFTHSLPIFAISIALMKKNEVVLGIVREINRKETFYAVKGENAFCNDRIIKVSPINTLAKSLLATGFPYYNFEKVPNYLTILNEFMKKTHGLRRMGSAAVDLVYVACGRFEGFFEYNLNAWDVAAGGFIVQQAGGAVTNFSGGDDFIFGREIVASGHVQKEMLDLIGEHWYRS